MIELTQEQLLAAADRVVDSVILLNAKHSNPITFDDDVEKYIFESGVKLGALQVIENLIHRNKPGFEWGKLLYEVIRDDE